MSGITNYPGGSNQNFTDESLNNFFSGPNSEFSNSTPGDDMKFNTDATVSPINLSMNADFNQQTYSGPMMPQQLPPTQIPSPTPMAQMPQMTNLGPSYDPRIGWYYPAQAPTSYPPPPPPMSAPYQALSVNEGYIPIAPPAQMMQPQMASQNGYYGMPPQQPVPQTNGSSQGNKREEYLGPAAHSGQNQQSKRQKRSAPDDFDDSDDEPRPRKTTRKTKQPTNTTKTPRTRKGPGRPKSTKLPVPPMRKRGKPPSIEMACVCATGVRGKSAVIKRPKNMFIIFRMQQQKQIMRDLHNDPTRKRNKAGTVAHDVISVEAGRRWKAMTTEQKKPYYDMATAEAEKHRELYPNYRYQPGGKGRDPNFGTPDCGCGAYQKNLAKLKREGGSEDDATGAESEPEELEEYVPPRSRPAYQAPSAPMYGAPAQQLPETMPDFGFSTPAQQAEAARTFAAMKAKHHAAAITIDDDDDTPAPTRRSGRNHAQVSYTEPTDNVEEEDEQEDPFEAALAAQLSEALNAPSPSMEGKTKRRPSAIFTPLNSPPALNTRSRSKGSLDLPTVPEDEVFDFDSDLFGEGGEFNMDDYMDYSLDAGDNETITVASHAGSRRTSTRRSSKASPKSHAGSPQGVEKRRGSSARSTRATRRSPRH